MNSCKDFLNSLNFIRPFSSYNNVKYKTHVILVVEKIRILGTPKLKVMHRKNNKIEFVLILNVKVKSMYRNNTYFVTFKLIKNEKY